MHKLLLAIILCLFAFPAYAQIYATYYSNGYVLTNDDYYMAAFCQITYPNGAYQRFMLGPQQTSWVIPGNTSYNCWY